MEPSGRLDIAGNTIDLNVQNMAIGTITESLRAILRYEPLFDLCADAGPRHLLPDRIPDIVMAAI